MSIGTEIVKEFLEDNYPCPDVNILEWDRVDREDLHSALTPVLPPWKLNGSVPCTLSWRHETTLTRRSMPNGMRAPLGCRMIAKSGQIKPKRRLLP
jgi:hypothetical protein